MAGVECRIKPIYYPKFLRKGTTHAYFSSYLTSPSRRTDGLKSNRRGLYTVSVSFSLVQSEE